MDSDNHVSDDRPRCLVVMYHYVHEPGLAVHDDAHYHGLLPSDFSAQLDHLCRRLEPIDWPMLYASMQGRKSIPRRCFLLTFDDGLADHARTVLPILQERGLRGAFFVPGSILVSRRMLSAHAIHILLSRLGEASLELELRGELARRIGKKAEPTSGDAPTSGPPLTSGNPFDSVDERAAERMYHYESPARARLKYLLTLTLPIELRNAVVNALFERFVGSAARWSQHWYLDWDDLTRMESLGHTIGGHGFSHEPYLRLTMAERHGDIRRVAKTLNDGLGKDIRPFSYPYGSFDDQTAGACRECGFVHAFTTVSRWVRDGDDPWRLPRVDTIHVDAAFEKEPTCSKIQA